MKPIKLNLATIIRILIVTAIVLIGIRYRAYLNSDTVANFVENSGVWAPIIFVAICAIKPLFFIFPVAGLTIVAGTLFGPLWGTLYIVIGGAFSTIIGFYFARWMGRDAIKRIYNANEKIRNFDTWTSAYGKKAIIYMRFFNLPWDLVSYWAGCSNIKFRDFYVASMIVLPFLSFLYASMGSKVFDPKNPIFILSLSAIVLLGICSMLKYRSMLKAGSDKSKTIDK